MAVIHVLLPAAYGWEQYLGMVTPRQATAVQLTSVFFSFLLLWGGCLTVLVALRRGRVGRVGDLILYALATFWAVYVLYQVRVPPPFSNSLRQSLTATGAVITVLYLVFLLTRDSERHGANTGSGSAETKSAPR